MKDNKGMTIVEILVSVVIISLCLTLLFTLLIQVRNEENNTSIQSEFKIIQASFIRQIEEDIVNYGVKAIVPCEPAAAGINTADIAKGHESDYKCIRIHYAADYLKDNIGFILIYNKYQKYDYEGGKYVGKEPAWSISYQRGSYKSCSSNNPVYNSWQFSTNMSRTLPNEVDLGDVPYILYTSTASTNAASIVVPIVNLEGDHYDLNLSFTFKNNNNFICSNDAKMLECKCLSSTALCNATLIQANDATGAITQVNKLKNHLCPT